MAHYPKHKKTKKHSLPSHELDDTEYIHQALIYIEQQHTSNTYSSLEELLSLSSIPTPMIKNITTYTYTWTGNKKDIRTFLETHIHTSL